MEGPDVMREYFFNIENNKDIDDGLYPEVDQLMCRIRDRDIWSQFVKLSFNSNDLQEYFTTQPADIRSKIFKFGISCFFHFIQANFTGPDLPEEVVQIITSPEYQVVDFGKILAVYNEEINVNTKFPALLVMAKCIFERCLVANTVNSLWHWRSILIHQQVMDELCALLLAQADSIYKQIDTFSLQGYEKAKFSIEFAQLYTTFHQSNKSKDHLSTAEDILGVKYQLLGKLGKRTKFQEKDVAQLTMEVTMDEKGMQRPEVEDFEVPQNVNLNDEVRLDRIAFADGSTEVPQIPNTEQKLLLAKVSEMMISKPQDDLHMEELSPFIDFVLAQKNTWAVRITALLLRCKLEVRFKRTLDRTLSQTKSILDSYQKTKPHVVCRVAEVFGTALLPMWKVEGQCADILISMGLIKHALDIYKKIKLWEEIIMCYTLMDKRQKAAEVIKEQLAIKETVKMWCLLGDATDDESCYEKAWDLSRKRSHRAQRHWGNYLYHHKKYKDCIPHYEKAVSINPLQPVVWLRLGFAALQTENWHVAATAYRRYTTMEPDGYQAWNNLAQAYIKIKNNRSAHGAILEALKYNYENWKIWENLLVISCDIMNLSNVIRAYHKLLDLKGKYLNIEALNVLVFNCCNDTCEETKKMEIKRFDNSENLLQRTRELLGRVTSIYPTDGFVWEMYAGLAPPGLLRTQRLQRAFRGYTQPGWDKNPKTCVQVLCVCIKLAEQVLHKNVDPQSALLTSVRLNLTTAIATIKKHDWSDTRDLINDVIGFLEEIHEKTKDVVERNDLIPCDIIIHKIESLD